ncbi:hypothetical protein [Pseudooceanicola sp. LIPI14-2-Ac024]|uniref:hypothetical protein n=1 Tax=Pseudooceanicola sp. LIPI14-2-Ac024 TaxID=3344875 RepID=UPI0035D0E4D7
MKSDLILHIGAHKTGTTTIQHALSQNRAALEARGLSYVTAGNRPQVHHLLGRVSGESMMRGHRLAAPEELSRILHAAPTDRVLMSSENFSFFFDEKEIRELARHLRKHFRRVRILTYLRRQDSHAVSHHQEGSKPLRKAERDVFGNGLAPLPEHPMMDHYLDYGRRIGNWMNVFGDENVEIRVFERNRLIAGDAWTDFLNAIDIEPNGLIPAEQRNQSQGLTKTRVGHLMNAKDMPADLHRLVSAVLPDDARMTPGRHEAMAFYARYRSGNVALNARMGAIGGDDIFDDDFASYPETALANWSEEAATGAIEALLDVIRQLTEATSADTLRDTALLAERQGLDALALSLMSAAALQRPNGPLINNKLRELRERIGTDPKTPGHT